MIITEYECEVISPMFLHGENSSEIELRPIAIKSLMRFWWRALNESLGEKLLEEEKKIFGGIGLTTYKSSFTIRISLKNYVETKKSLTPHKKNNMKKAIQVGTKFNVIFFINNSIQRKVENIFEISTVLGGLGMRSRRAFGAIKILKKNKENYEIAEVKSIYNLIAEVSEKEKFELNNNKIVYKDIEMIKNETALKSIEIISKNKEVDYILKEISQITHDIRKNNLYLCDLALGKAIKGRLASPVYVSIEILGKERNIIISKLSFLKQEKEFEKKIENIQDDFINMIRRI